MSEKEVKFLPETYFSSEIYINQTMNMCVRNNEPEVYMGFCL